jgi:hypothetical protein
MTIDWERFAACVPAGTRIRSVDYDPLDDGLEINEGDEGVVTRHRREINDPAAREYGYNQLYCKFDHLEDEWPMHQTSIEYFIDGRYQSFDELMT